MKTKNTVIMLLVAVTVFSGLFLVPAVSSGQDCRVIRMHGQATDATSVFLEPETVWIPKGTCIIWFNQTNGYEVVVKFTEGKVCEDVTDAPVQFRMTAENCYVSSSIVAGGTSSLRFMQPGSYHFEITDTKGTGLTKGKIIVQN